MPEGGEGDPVPQPEGERKEGRGVWAVPVGFLYGASPWKGKGGCLCTRLAFPRALPRAHPHSLGEKGQGDSEPSFLGLPITPEHFLPQETQSGHALFFTKLLLFLCSAFVFFLLVLHLQAMNRPC